MTFYIMILQNADNLTADQRCNFTSNFTAEVGMFPFLLKHVVSIFNLPSSTHSGSEKWHPPFEQSILKKKTLLSTHLPQTTKIYIATSVIIIQKPINCKTNKWQVLYIAIPPSNTPNYTTYRNSDKRDIYYSAWNIVLLHQTKTACAQQTRKAVTPFYEPQIRYCYSLICTLGNLWDSVSDMLREKCQAKQHYFI
jgi:hypothetical protein